MSCNHVDAPLDAEVRETGAAARHLGHLCFAHASGEQRLGQGLQMLVTMP
jgi:hypothetical protein